MNKKSLFLVGASIFSAIALFALISTPTQAAANCAPSMVYKILATDSPLNSTNKITPPAGCIGPVQTITPLGSATSPTSYCSWTYGNDTNGRPVPKFGFRYAGRNWGLSKWDATNKQATLYFYDASEADYWNNSGSCQVKLTWKVDPNYVPPTTPNPPVPPTPTQNCRLEINNNSNAPYKAGDNLDFRLNITGCSTPSDLTWSIDWGEGAGESGTSGPAPLYNVYHVFSKNGTYQVKFRAFTNTSANNYPHLAFPGVFGQTSVTISDGSAVPPSTPDQQTGNYDIVLSTIPSGDTFEFGQSISINSKVVRKGENQVANFSGLSGKVISTWTTEDGQSNSIVENTLEVNNDQKITDQIQFEPSKPGTYIITSNFKAGSDFLSPVSPGLLSALSGGGLSASKTITVKGSSTCNLPPDALLYGAEVFAKLNQIQPVKIAAKDLKSWVQKNEAAFRTEVISNQVCYAESNSKTQAKDIINYLNTNVGVQKNKNAVPLVLHELGDEVDHLVIALGFKKVGTTYRLDYLDPNGPKIVKNKVCRTKFLSSGVYLVCSISPGKDTQILIPSNPKDFGVLQLIANQVRNDTAGYILKGNYPSIGNFADENGRGVCSGWVHTTLKLVYLADFVGECKPTSALPFSNQLAAPGFISILQLLLFPFNIQPSN